MVEKMYLQSVDGFIFNSQTTASVVDSVIARNKPSVVAYPPTDRFRDAVLSNAEIEKRAKNDELRILFLGNVIYRKGLHTLLNALKGLKSQVKLDVVGRMDAEPRYAEEMRKLTTLNELSSVVTFHGALDNEPLMNIFKRSHILVVPSSYEGFGIAYLEGMGFGFPAIGTTEVAATEIIDDGVNGYLIKLDDVETLSHRITGLIQDRSLLVQLSLNAIDKFNHMSKWEDTAERIREFLSAIRNF